MDITYFKPLFQAIREIYGNKSDNEILFTLKKYNIDITRVTKYKITLIEIASILGNTNIIKRLLDLGEDINGLSTNGYSALFLMCYNNKVKIAQFLINNGADVNLRYSSGWTLLMLASYKGYTEIVKMLLSAGAFVNYRLNMIPNSPTLSYATALHFACEHNNNEIIKLLINYGATINVKTEYNSTPLYISIMKNNAEIVERLLVEYENIQAYYLEYATEVGNKKIIELLENTINRTTKLHILANTAINMDIIL